MSTRASAARYARALLDVAVKESSTEQADRELTAFVDLLRQHPDLQRALIHPSVNAAAKKAVVQQLLDRLQPSSSPAGKLLLMLAERDRLVLLQEVAEVYRERLNEQQRIVRAEVTTAEPLADEHAARLRDRLAAATGQTVTLTTKVDPSIIGGMVTRIGSTVYDGSVATQLQTIKQQLASRF
jgi:F-type H+-transporting ATPase subunit delta